MRTKGSALAPATTAMGGDAGGREKDSVIPGGGRGNAEALGQGYSLKIRHDRYQGEMMDGVGDAEHDLPAERGIRRGLAFGFVGHLVGGAERGGQCGRVQRERAFEKGLGSADRVGYARFHLMVALAGVVVDVAFTRVEKRLKMLENVPVVAADRGVECLGNPVVVDRVVESGQKVERLVQRRGERRVNARVSGGGGVGGRVGHGFWAGHR